MKLVVIISDIMVILAIVNIALMVIYLTSGHLPLWLFLWQGIWGILIAIVLTVVSRRHGDYKERRIMAN